MPHIRDPITGLCVVCKDEGVRNKSKRTGRIGTNSIRNKKWDQLLHENSIANNQNNHNFRTGEFPNKNSFRIEEKSTKQNGPYWFPINPYHRKSHCNTENPKDYSSLKLIKDSPIKFSRNYKQVVDNIPSNRINAYQNRTLKNYSRNWPLDKESRRVNRATSPNNPFNETEKIKPDIIHVLPSNYEDHPYFYENHTDLPRYILFNPQNYKISNFHQNLHQDELAYEIPMRYNQKIKDGVDYDNFYKNYRTTLPVIPRLHNDQRTMLNYYDSEIEGRNLLPKLEEIPSFRKQNIQRSPRKIRFSDEDFNDQNIQKNQITKNNNKSKSCLII